MMRTMRKDIAKWLQQGVKKKATHVFVVCDSFDHEDYPVFVMPGDDVRQVYARLDGKQMQRVMEIYKMSMDLVAQLDQPRARNF
jgi:hypothetical protein